MEEDDRCAPFWRGLVLCFALLRAFVPTGILGQEEVVHDGGGALAPHCSAMGRTNRGRHSQDPRNVLDCPPYNVTVFVMSCGVVSGIVLRSPPCLLLHVEIVGALG